jgi:hypothetical protein
MIRHYCHFRFRQQHLWQTPKFSIWVSVDVWNSKFRCSVWANRLGLLQAILRISCPQFCRPKIRTTKHQELQSRYKLKSTHMTNLHDILRITVSQILSTLFSSIWWPFNSHERIWLNMLTAADDVCKIWLYLRLFTELICRCSLW